MSSTTEPATDGAAVWAGNFPDPFVLRSDGAFWAYGTNSGGRNVQVLHATALDAWRPAGDALPHLPSWAVPGRTWSPSVLRRADGWIHYVAVREPSSDRQAIMVARATTPAGPFEPVGDGPLVFQAEVGGSIDPSPFVDTDGTAWLTWKSDANAVQRPSSLWAQALTPDGLSVRGTPTELLTVDAEWERPLIEAPALLRDGGTYYLFYSAGRWASDGYGVGYAVADGPLGPWRRVTDRAPWLASGAGVSGPGGQEFFTDAEDQLWMAYHGWQPGLVTYRAGGQRTLRLTRVSFVDGHPMLAIGGTGPDGSSGGSWIRRLLGR